MTLRLNCIAIPLILGVTQAPAPRAQAQSDLRFEVASVRRVEIPTVSGGVPVFPVTGGVGTSEPRRIAYRGTWLKGLIAHAFEVRSDQITGPEWLGQARYDIIANIPAGTTRDQFKIMLGNLLRDRFQLRFHMDTKVRPVYALRVAKNGPKFKETARRDDDATGTSRPVMNRDARGFPVLPPDYRGMVSFPVPGEIFVTAQDYSIPELARSFEFPAGRPVVDETGLAGRYDFKIHYEYLVRRPGTDGVASAPAPSIFTALEEQLGLKLEPATSPFPQLTIDSIEREPADN